jgi:hypothetical protein
MGGGDMRGRQSFNPIEKMGLALIVNDKIKISSFGKYFLQEDYDLGNVFFRSFLKWKECVERSISKRKADLVIIEEDKIALDAFVKEQFP